MNDRFNFYLTGSATLKFHQGIKTALALILGALLLSGCGSEDKFPGSSDNQDPDPLVADIPLFYIERNLRTDETGAIIEDDLKDPLTFRGGARLYMKARADQSAATTDISARAVSGNVDVRDLDVSADGTRVVFSLRAPQIEDADEEDQPTWNLWEYNIETDTVTRIISDNNLAEKGHDITPRYLPDDRIIFASTRQQKSRSILQDEGKDQFSHLEEDRQQPALNLHVFDPETGVITQVSFNQSHDFYPAVRNNGKVVFSRWDNFNNDAVTLYEMNPDGTELQILYGHHSQDTGTNDTELRFIRSDILPDGDLFVLARPDETTFYGGDFVRIDTDRYIDNTQPIATSSGSGPAQRTVTEKEVYTDGTLSPGGYFSAFYPLWDGTSRAVVSWSRCRVNIGETTLPCTDDNVNDPAATIAPAAYGIWTYDYGNNTQTPVIVARSGVVYTDVALAAARTAPAIRGDGESRSGVVDGKVSASTFSAMTDPSNEEAIIHIRSVYDIDGAFNDLTTSAVLDYATLSNPALSDANDRPARFLRVVKAVSEPPREVKQPANGSFGNAGAQRMKEIIGYAPIEPDGSVKVRVPANVALMLSVVDADGKRITARHQNWISLRPGEVLECKGCHTRTSEAPHGRYDAQPDSINIGQPLNASYPGADATITSPFANATMAEARVAYAEIDGDGATGDDDIMELTTDLLYSDAWTDTGSEAADEPITIRYEDLPAGLASPASNNCTPWNSRCRVVINYAEHILPIWSLDRGALTAPIRDRQGQVIVDAMDQPVTQILASDGQPATCTRCHNPTWMLDNADVNGDPQTQLNLADTPAEANGIQHSSYVDLFNRDVSKVVDGGALVDCFTDVPRVDENGDPVLDGNGIQIVDREICTPNVGPYMSSGGARASNAFFSVFEGAGSHVGYLTAAELKLIAEWLDIGGQYYNNHFDAPDN